MNISHRCRQSHQHVGNGINVTKSKNDSDQGEAKIIVNQRIFCCLIWKESKCWLVNLSVGVWSLPNGKMYVATTDHLELRFLSTYSISTGWSKILLDVYELGLSSQNLVENFYLTTSPLTQTHIYKPHCGTLSVLNFWARSVTDRLKTPVSAGMMRICERSRGKSTFC